jgi:hypothetical protein
MPPSRALYCISLRPVSAAKRGATYTADSARHPFWRVVGERAAERYFSRAAEGSLYQREISLPMAGAAGLLTVEKHTGLFQV